jgi:hypothetical protein
MLGEILTKIANRGLEKFGRYYSSYRGFVLVNEDPDKQNKLFVYIPAITGLKSEGLWAYPKGVVGGLKWGSKITPQKGDMVWVEFEYGNPRFPIWTFGYRRKGESEETPIPDSPTDYGFATPNGNYVNISDDGNVISVQTVGGNQVVLNDDSEYIALISKGGQQVVLDDAAGIIKINDGANGGLININSLVQKINVLEQRMNTHQHIYVPPSGTPAPTVIDPTTNPTIVLTSPSDIEDSKVTH